MANYSAVAGIFNHPNVLQDYFENALVNQIPLVWCLEGKPVASNGMKPTAPKMVKEVDAGSRFEEPIMLVSNGNIKSYAKDAIFDMTTDNVGDRAYYDIKSIGGPIVMYGFDIDICGSNKTNLLNYQASLLEQAKTTMINSFATQYLKAIGTAGADDFASLYDIVSTSAGATIGGISSTTYSNWDNTRATSTGSMATYLKSDLTNLIINASYGQSNPKLIVTTKSIYSTLHGQLVSNQRYVPDTELAKAGFKAIEYDGLSVIFDGGATTGTILGIDPDGLMLGKLKGTWMNLRPPVATPDADVMSSFIKARGNLIVKSRRSQFIGDGFTIA